jgi:hypothetical protein
MQQVYKEELCRRHYVGVFSSAYIFRVVVFLSAVVLAFTVAFATGGFWRKVNAETEQPTVHYTGDAVAIFEVGGAALSQLCMAARGARPELAAPRVGDCGRLAAALGGRVVAGDGTVVQVSTRCR